VEALRVLVTGGAGFIGSNLVRACLAAGEEVRVLDDLSTGHEENLAEIRDRIDFRRGSVVDFDAVESAVAGCEVVYHQAALPSVPRSIEEPLEAHAANATGTLHVLEAARRTGVRRVVYAASSSAYGDSDELPKVESMPPRPLSPYALQKLVGEIYCRQYSELFGLETVSLRYFNIFGPRQDPHSAYAAVIPRFAGAILRGDRPVIFGDGLQSRDFTFVADAVAANRAAAAGPPESSGEVFNVACGGRVTLLELLERICKALDRPPVEPVFEPPRPGDVRHSQADVSKAARLLGWRPQHSLDDGLRQTVQHLAGKARA
jgi:UDP-glucose 4-epimerase